jgi:Uma2 family endonuclease
MSVMLVPERMRISADRYEMMIATGVLTKYDRIELIDGDMINMAPIGLPHSAITARLTKLFVLSAGDSAMLSPGGSVRLGGYSVPQPDLMLLKPRDDYYSGQRPTPSDVILVVEVSDRSVAFDQGTKRALYARHGIAEYWVIDIPGQRVHVYREPSANGYAIARAFSPADVVSPRDFPAIQITVGTLFV